ncbi:MAG: outer membrane beta-barrel protein [Pseudomonadota bacterium]
MKLASKTLSLVALAVIASPHAAADDLPWYGGVNVGQSRADIDNARITRGLLDGGFATTSISDDDRDIGYKLFGGYRFHKNFAIEAGYFDLGKFDFTATTVPPGTLNGEIKLKGLNVDAVGILPINDKFSAFGRAGLIYAQAKDSFSGTGAVNVLDSSPSESEANYKFGLGLQYDVTDALGFRLEAERYRINDAVGNDGDVDLLSAGLIYRFGGKASTAAARATSEPMVAAAASSPATAASPASRALKKVSFSTDSLFDYDKTTVTPTGRQSLDKFTADLKGVKFESINVTGHTDRIGEPAYNMELSTRRAEEVKKYLVDSAGIPADKIVAKGASGSEPVTKPGECKGEEATPQLIACLQPDRRVEVEVAGTK